MLPDATGSLIARAPLLVHFLYCDDSRQVFNGYRSPVSNIETDAPGARAGGWSVLFLALTACVIMFMISDQW
jgi:hypothetical protein